MLVSFATPRLSSGRTTLRLMSRHVDSYGRPHIISDCALVMSPSRRPVSLVSLYPRYTGSTSRSSEPGGEEADSLRESPFTLPNALTLARLAACPFLGYTIVQGDSAWATGILFASGFSDWLDGYIARKWHQRSVLGSILDPAADKALMTTLVGTLAWVGLLPIPLAMLIFGRDIALSLSALYFRYTSLPQPRTLQRYFNPSIPSAEVKPTQISKINTALQLVLMGVTTVSPILPFDIVAGLTGLQWTVAGTTIWSGLSYIGQGGFTVLQQPPPPRG